MPKHLILLSTLEEVTARKHPPRRVDPVPRHRVCGHSVLASAFGARLALHGPPQAPDQQNDFLRRVLVELREAHCAAKHASAPWAGTALRLPTWLAAASDG